VQSVRLDSRKVSNSDDGGKVAKPSLDGVSKMYFVKVKSRIVLFRMMQVFTQELRKNDR
jgi:hypothetical protein